MEAAVDATDLPSTQVSPGQPGGKVEAITYARIASILNPKQCYQWASSLINPNNTPLSSSVSLGAKSNLPILGTIIGNVSPNNSPNSSRLWISTVGANNLLQQVHLAQPAYSVPSWFEAGAFVHSCPSWDASQNFAVQDISTSTDVQLVPSSMANKVICYLTGISGNWGYTVPDPANPGGSIQAYAEIYVGPSNDIRLKTFSPGVTATPISASASCLKVDP
ncbi:MAG: hypothetical protein MUF64_25555 [Polyangiaceae bacterium]|nr:hypothetical protein [Polyangiaceae bacterium]